MKPQAQEAPIAQPTGDELLAEWRRDGEEREHFASLDVAEIAEEEGDWAAFFGPSHPEKSEANLRQVAIQKTLGELPRRVQMPAQELAAHLVGGLPKLLIKAQIGAALERRAAAFFARHQLESRLSFDGLGRPRRVG